MRTENKLYVAPQIEVVNIEIEDAILSISGDTTGGVAVDPFEEVGGRF